MHATVAAMNCETKEGRPAHLFLLLADHSNGARALVLLLLLDELHGHVLSLGPVDLAAERLVERRAVVPKRIALVLVRGQLVRLGEHRVREELVRLEVELDRVAERLLALFSKDTPMLVIWATVHFANHEDKIGWVMC